MTGTNSGEPIVITHPALETKAVYTTERDGFHKPVLDDGL